MNPHQELGVIGLPATIITWLTMLDIMTLTPIATLVASSLSTIWLSLQIYGWIEKRIKNKKNVSK